MITGALLNSLVRDAENLFAMGKAQFNPGQFLKGKVLQILPNRQAVFQINGMKVLAKVEMDVTEGDHVWLQVKSSGQPTEFKMVTQWTKLKGLSPSFKDGIEELTRALGIQPSSVEKELLSRMVEDKIPISSKIWDTLTKALAELGGRKEDIELLLLTVKKGYPLSKEVLFGLKTFLQGTGFRSIVESLQQELDQGVLTYSAIPPQTQDLARDLQLLLRTLTTELEPHSFNGDRIRKGLESIRNLDQLQNVLLAWKQQSTDIPALKGIREKTEQLLQFITGQQFMLQPSEGLLQHMVLHIPMKPFGEQAFVQLEGKKKENGQLDPENCRLLFCLDLNHLGDIIMDVRVFNRVVSMEVYGDHPARAQFLECKQELQEDLKGLGYQLSVLKVSEHDSREKSAPNPAFITPYKGVDFRI